MRTTLETDGGAEIEVDMDEERIFFDGVEQTIDDFDDSMSFILDQMNNDHLTIKTNHENDD